MDGIASVFTDFLFPEDRLMSGLTCSGFFFGGLAFGFGFFAFSALAFSVPDPI